MTAKHNIDHVFLFSADGMTVETLTQEQAIILATELLDSAGHIKEKPEESEPTFQRVKRTMVMEE